MNVCVMDVGTSSMRGILFDREGNIWAQAREKYRPVYKSSVWVEQESGDFYAACVKILREITAKAAGKKIPVDALAITAQRSAVIPLDKDGSPLMPAIMWQDTRNARLCQELSRENDRVFALSGTTVNTVFSGGKMAWIKRECPQIASGIRRFVNIPEYLIYRMTGSFASDYTYGSRSNLMNLARREWDPCLLELFGIREEELCALLEPGSVAGTVTAEFAEASGVTEGTPVITAGGDQQCAAVGQGAFKEGTLSVVAGTGAYLAACCDRIPEKLSREIVCNCAAIPGKYILEASVLTCSSALDWYLRNFYGEPVDYDRVNKELAKLYDRQEEALVLPWFQGRGSSGWNAEARGVFADITLSATREDILKALVEGIFLEIGSSIRRLRRYMEISRVYVSGGMANSAVMNQMQADIYGLPLKCRKNREATAVGALLVTLVAQGEYCFAGEAFEALCKRNRETDYEPDPTKALWYERKRQRMEELGEKLYGGGTAPGD